MKKALSAILTALLFAGVATSVSAAWEENVDYAIIAESIDPSYAKSTEKLPAVVKGELLTGKVFVSVGEDGPEVTDVNTPVNLFDGNITTYYNPRKDNYNIFGGILLDQAYELTEIRIAPTNASGFDTSSNFGIVVQGSNDGENWVDIIRRFQDATSYGYHIYTPHTVQEYVDAGAIKVMTDDSIFWKGKGGAYQMYRVCGNSAGEVEFYGIPGEPTVLTPELTSAINNPTIHYFNSHFNIRNVRVESTEGNLPGYVIGAGGAWNKAVYERAFDGKPKTDYTSPLEAQDGWVGMMFDEPMALTGVKVMPKRGHYTMWIYQVQGSNDGVNWVTLCEFEEEDTTDGQEWVYKEITDPNGYLYVRYISIIERITTTGDLLFFGAPAPAAEPVAAEIPVATIDTYTGELDFLEDKTSVSLNGSITGQIFGNGYGWRTRGQGYESAWDGDTATFYTQVTRVRGTQYFTGIKPDAPAAVAQVRVHHNDIGDHHYIQGSNDGIHWSTLATFGFADKPNADGWYIKDVTDTTEYAYFRWVNDGYSDLSVNEIALYTAESIPQETEAPETAAPETAAPETAAPETQAPETAAPETAAPETQAPETKAPETEAPETKAPETKAPETEAKETDAPKAEEPAESNNMGLIIGIVAAVVVVAIVVGVIIKKKK